MEETGETRVRTSSWAGQLACPNQLVASWGRNSIRLRAGSPASYPSKAGSTEPSPPLGHRTSNPIRTQSSAHTLFLMRCSHRPSPRVTLSLAAHHRPALRDRMILELRQPAELPRHSATKLHHFLPRPSGLRGPDRHPGTRVGYLPDRPRVVRASGEAGFNLLFEKKANSTVLYCTARWETGRTFPASQTRKHGIASAS